MERLRELRKQADISGYALAKEVGMTSTGYYRLEHGVGKPTYHNLILLAKALAERLNREPSDVLAELTGVNKQEESRVVSAA